jgi:hypothetical protein
MRGPIRTSSAKHPDNLFSQSAIAVCAYAGIAAVMAERGKKGTVGPIDKSTYHFDGPHVHGIEDRCFGTDHAGQENLGK